MGIPLGLDQMKISHSFSRVADGPGLLKNHWKQLTYSIIVKKKVVKLVT